MIKKCSIIFFVLFGIIQSYAQQTITAEGVSTPVPVKITVGNTKTSDAQGPSITIFKPAESEVFAIDNSQAQIDQAKGIKPATKINFSGYVIDPSGIESFKINNQIVNYNMDGQYNVDLSFAEGTHKVVFEAKDKVGNISNAQRTIVVNKNAFNLVELKKRNLHVLSIGVSNFKYSNDKLPNLTYADDDAIAIEKTFKSMEGVLYNKVTSKLLINQDATREAIILALYDLEKNASQGDVVIIFISTHGFKEDEYSYIMPYDGQTDKLRISAVNFSDINQTVSKLSERNQRNCRVLLLIDACHSGQIGVQFAAKGANQLSIDNALATLNKNEYGVMMFHSSESSEVSYEDKAWGHGAFTYAILEALQNGKGDANGDFVIIFDEMITYVKERVKTLTGGKQHPVSHNPATITEFPITVIK